MPFFKRHSNGQSTGRQSAELCQECVCKSKVLKTTRSWWQVGHACPLHLPQAIVLLSGLRMPCCTCLAYFRAQFQPRDRERAQPHELGILLSLLLFVYALLLLFLGGINVARTAQFTQANGWLNTGSTRRQSET